MISNSFPGAVALLYVSRITVRAGLTDSSWCSVASALGIPSCNDVGPARVGPTTAAGRSNATRVAADPGLGRHRLGKNQANIFRAFFGAFGFNTFHTLTWAVHNGQLLGAWSLFFFLFTQSRDHRWRNTGGVCPGKPEATWPNWMVHQSHSSSHPHVATPAMYQRPFIV